MDKSGRLKAVKLVDIEWAQGPKTGRFAFQEVEGTECDIPCQPALLAVGFLHPQYEGMLQQLGIEVDERGNVRDESCRRRLDKFGIHSSQCRNSLPANIAQR